MRRITLPTLMGALSAIQKIGGVSSAMVKKRTPLRTRRLASDTFKCSSSKMRYYCPASRAAKGIQNAMDNPYPRSARRHVAVGTFTISIVFWHKGRLILGTKRRLRPQTKCLHPQIAYSDAK